MRGYRVRKTVNVDLTDRTVNYFSRPASVLPGNDYVIIWKCGWPQCYTLREVTHPILYFQGLVLDLINQVVKRRCRVTMVRQHTRGRSELP